MYRIDIVLIIFGVEYEIWGFGVKGSSVSNVCSVLISVHRNQHRYKVKQKLLCRRDWWGRDIDQEGLVSIPSSHLVTFQIGL